MRRLLIGVAAAGALLCTTLTPSSEASQLSALRKVFGRDLNAAGGTNGAYVLDLMTRKELYAAQPRAARLPASVQKLYTTSTALLRFGSNARLQTTIYGLGKLQNGTWHGDLFLRGGGDPTFGSRSFDNYAYGTGATMQQLVAKVLRDAGIKSVTGRVIGDETLFDSARGTAPYGFQVATDIGGPLSALEYDRGLADEQGTAFQDQPAYFTAERLVLALRAAGVRVPGGSVGVGRTPLGAQNLVSVGSPTIANLIRMTNVPSDNLFAELLLKSLGARFAGRGSTAAGAGVVRAQLAAFGVHPVVQDGSGLSRGDHTSPLQVVKLLAQMASSVDFVRSLAVAGRSGTLAARMNGTAADGRCRAKTGTLHDVSDLAGYCLARDGHMLAFAILQNSLDPNSAHPLQDEMAIALARYNG